MFPQKLYPLVATHESHAWCLLQLVSIMYHKNYFFMNLSIPLFLDFSLVKYILVLFSEIVQSVANSCRRSCSRALGIIGFLCYYVPDSSRNDEESESFSIQL